MGTKAGVWIDHHQAVVVLITDTGEETRQIESLAERPFASAGGPGSKQPNRPTRFIPESTQEQKFMNHLNTYYDKVLTCLRDADAILILGPGEAKGEFYKRLESKKVPGRAIELQTADKMTDRQIAASVRQHFGVALPRR